MGQGQCCPNNSGLCVPRMKVALLLVDLVRCRERNFDGIVQSGVSKWDSLHANKPLHAIHEP